MIASPAKHSTAAAVARVKTHAHACTHIANRAFTCLYMFVFSHIHRDFLFCTGEGRERCGLGETESEKKDKEKGEDGNCSFLIFFHWLSLSAIISGGRAGTEAARTVSKIFCEILGRSIMTGVQVTKSDTELGRRHFLLTLVGW